MKRRSFFGVVAGAMLGMLGVKAKAGLGPSVVFYPTWHSSVAFYDRHLSSEEWEKQLCEALENTEFIKPLDTSVFEGLRKGEEDFAAARTISLEEAFEGLS